MAGKLYYLLTSLPTLGEIGTAPPMGCAEMLDQVGPNTRPGQLVGLIFLSDDLIQREAFLAGEIQQVEPTVLDLAQVRNEAPLPEFLGFAEEDTAEPSPRSLETDRVWAAYFRHTAEVARREDCSFVQHWVGMEVALRNALAQERAKRLGLEPVDYVVVPELADTEIDFTEMLREWASAPTPLVGWRVVLRSRWDWAQAHEAWFSFTEDEVLVYAMRLLLLSQWQRSSEEASSASLSGGGKT